ncbi:MAG TPA: sensor histidine kinase, partial [Candidatus Coatesbacteria bacterium]|nr:sensor histidine kinase [Candidatus Coatesbacteria bacterium]
QVDIDTAIPLALVINELVANALEHAFPDGRRGTITIGLKRAGTTGAVLKIADDGVGLGEEVDFQNTKTLGLQLVSMLTQQLGAEIRVLRPGAKQKHGTEFIITLGDKTPREDHEA